jgi:hypothetical protein
MALSTLDFTMWANFEFRWCMVKWIVEIRNQNTKLSGAFSVFWLDYDNQRLRFELSTNFEQDPLFTRCLHSLSGKISPLKTAGTPGESRRKPSPVPRTGETSPRYEHGKLNPRIIDSQEWRNEQRGEKAFCWMNRLQDLICKNEYS